MICAVLAERKGRGPVGWFVMGFLFSFLTLILLLVLSDLIHNATEKSWVVAKAEEWKKETENKQRLARVPAISVSDTRDCPYCAETIKKAAIVCRFCGRDVPAAPDEAVAPTAASTVKPLLLDSGRIVCPECGSEHLFERTRCWKCGAAFSP